MLRKQEVAYLKAIAAAQGWRAFVAPSAKAGDVDVAFVDDEGQSFFIHAADFKALVTAFERQVDKIDCMLRRDAHGGGEEWLRKLRGLLALLKARR